MNKHIFVAFLATLFSLFFIQSLSAQELRGRIVDEQNQPLIGATILWQGTTIGTTTDANGEYRLHRVKDHNTLLVSYLGYALQNRVMDAEASADFMLQSEGVGIDEVVVESTIGGNFIKQDGVLKGEMISFAGLCKMACCNLAESFENSASVTVGYSDAISGARQIKMLGLAGTYTQILDENRPIMRGLSAPYGLSYTPGMWLNSIQVSKGVASVTAGHEAITGQINLEHRKPTDSERLFINAYLDDELKPELNISSALPVTKDNKLTTVILAHGSMDTDQDGMDHNHDLFRDMPRSRQVNVANRWLYQATSGLQLRWGAKYVEESRLGGMQAYSQSMHEEREQMTSKSGWLSIDDARSIYDSQIYGSHIHNRNANAYVKVGTPLGRSIYDEENEEELRSNIAAIVDYDHFNEDAYFGLTDYLGEENAVTANVMYNHYFSTRSSLIAGLSGQVRMYDEKLHTVNFGNDVVGDLLSDFNRDENEVGAYAEYTYNVKDKFSLIVGARGDYNSYYDKFYFTPRGHVKWNITPTTVLRASAGMGYRSTNIITDNIGILATGRIISFGDSSFEKLNRMEEALTFGGSFTQTFTLVREHDATISLDYFRTQFFNQVVADQEYMPGVVYFYSTDQKSFTDSYQVDFTWSPVERLDIFATFRYTDSAITLDRPDGTQERVERPLISRYKTLLNVQYATKFRRWTFDATFQYNGKSRLPVLDGGNLSDAQYSPSYPMLFAQVSRKIGKFDIYLGCENILDYTQDDPIKVGGEKFQQGNNPFSSTFNSSVVWGPLMGRKIYIGMRFNLY